MAEKADTGTVRDQMDKMTKKQIDAAIREAKKQIKEVDLEISEKEARRAELSAAGSKKLSRLKAAHRKDIEALDAEKKALEEDIKTFEEEILKTAAKEKKKQDGVARRKNELKDRHKEVIIEEMARNRKKHDEEMTEYDSRLEELRTSKKKQNEAFNESATKLKTSYKTVKDELTDRNMKLRNRKEKLEKESKEEIELLEKEKEDLLVSGKEELSRLSDDIEDQVKRYTEEEEMVLNQKKAELNSWLKKLDEANEKKAQTDSEYERTIARLDNEYRDLSNKYDVERSSLNQRNDSLRKEIELRREENEKQRGIFSERYKQSLNELNDLIAAYGDKEAVSSATLERVLQDKNEEYKRRYTELVDYLNEQYIQEKTGQEKEIADLRYRLELEQEEMRKRNSYLKERYENRENEYKRTNENLIRDNSELEEKITELENSYASRVNDLNAELLALRNSHEAAVDEKKKELAERLEGVRTQRAAFKEKIAAEKDEVSKQISSLDTEMARIKEELNEYIANAKVKENDLKARQEDQVAAILKEKDNIDALRAELEERISEDNRQREEMMAEIDAKRKAIDEEHEAKLIDIEGTHTAMMEDLRNKQEDLIYQTNHDHEELLNKLTSEHETLKKELEDEDIRRKNEFDQAKADLLKQTQDLEDDNEARINKIHAQKSDLLNRIQILKEDIDSELERFNADKKEMEDHHDEIINELEVSYRAQIEEINADMTPIDELEEVKNIFNKKSLEHDTVLKDAEVQKAQIDKEISDYITVSDKEKAELEDRLSTANHEYEERERQADEEYVRFQNELADATNKLQEFDVSMKQQLSDIKARNEDEMARLIARQEQQYSELSASYKEKEESVQNIYDQEIRFRSDELEAKRADYNNHLEDIRRRKAKMEYDYNNRFNTEIAKTEALQKELDEAGERLKNKRNEWSAELELRKAEYDEEINGIEMSHKTIITENKRAFEEKMAGIRRNISELKNEIHRLDEEANATRNELDAYKSGRTDEYARLRAATNDYLNDINKRLNELSVKESELESIHSARVIDIKKQIVRSLAECENLNRTLPFMLKKEEDLGDDELVRRASEFKEKIDSLEKAHKDIMERLSKRKENALTRAGEELASIMAADETLDSEHEADFEEIEKAYTKLIDLEKGKHEDLLKEIAFVDETLEKGYEEFLKEAVNYDLTERRQNLIADADKEVLSLEDMKNKALADIEDLIKGFDLIDDEISLKKAELLDVFKSKVKEIDDYYEKVVEDNRMQYRDLDIMKDDVTGIFKKRS